jgi:hypothetical protein
MPHDFARPLLPLLAIGLYLAMRAPSAPVQARRQACLSEALIQALVKQGWIGDSREVLWVDSPDSGGWTLGHRPRVILRAHRTGEPSDVLLVRARVSPEGRLLAITRVDNLSDTAAVDEAQIRISGNKVAWTVSVGDETTAIHTVDLNGVKLPQSEELNWLARTQLHLTWLQDWGQLSGIARREFRINPPAKRVNIAFDGDIVLARIDEVPIQLNSNTSSTSGERVVQVPESIGHPGSFITWAVDRVRALPWFGSDRMQLAKTLAFDAADRFERLRGRMTSDNGLSSLNDELGAALEGAVNNQTDPESGWPPSSMTPVLKEILPHEGQWIELNRDPFVLTREGTPAPFLFSFIRTDRERPYTKVFIVLWDPRHIELHTMSGTREPKTATGETGPGQVPRDDGVISRFVGAFNGGFQATHGEFGMMAEKVVYLPPKPYAATVARLADGSTGFGTWPNDDNIPESITSFRQNLTPLVMDDLVNPYHRTWWGGVPPGWEDATRTVRTGLCLTREGFVGYLYGSGIDSTHLATAMQAARCQYGLQLDMNPGHTGFEFYRVGRKGTLPELGRKLDSQSEAKGDIQGANGWEFMGRRMIRFMNLMHFPRYVRTESRDFFYLTERPLLPLPALKVPIEPREPAEGIWQTKTLSQQGWPPAIATTRYRPDPTRPNLHATLVAIDCKWLQLAKRTDNKLPTIFSIEPNELGANSTGLWFTDGAMKLQAQSPSSDARRLASGTEDPSRIGRAGGAVGQLNGQIWVYVELSGSSDRARDAATYERILNEVGAHDRLYFGQPISVRLDSRVPASPAATGFVRQQGPHGMRVFEDTPIVSPKVWMPLQDKRLRYTKQPKAARPLADGSALPEATPRSESKIPDPPAPDPVTEKEP